MSENINEQIMLTSDLTDGVSTYADNQSYFPIGKGGRINLFNGDFYYFNEEIKAGGIAFPFSFSYNFIGKESIWKLSTTQHLSFNEAPVLQAYYYDGLNNAHYFEDNDSCGYGKDTSGLDLKLNGSYGYGDSYILDKYDNKLVFDSNNYLYKVIDNNGNFINIEKTKITDSFGRETLIEYESQKLIKITDSSNRITNFEYDPNGRLTKIIHPDSSTTEFIYGSSTANKNFVAFKERDGITYAINNTANNQKEIKIFGEGKDHFIDEADEIIVINFGSKAIVQDRSNIKKVYIFDGGGRLFSTYEEIPLVVDGLELEDRRQLKGAAFYQYADKKKVFSCVLDQNDDEANLIQNGSFDNGINNWSGALPSSVTDEDSIDGGNSYKVKSQVYSYLYSQLKQSVSLVDFDYKNGRGFVLSGWAKSRNCNVELKGVVYYSDGTIEEFKEYFNSSVSTWQFLPVPITVNKDKNAQSIDVFVESTSYNGWSTVYIDNIRLVNTPSESITYSEVGDRNENNEYYTVDEVIFGKEYKFKKKSAHSDSVNTVIKYEDDKQNVVKTEIIDREGNEFVSYSEYDDNHNLIYSQDYRGIITKYTYNSVGMVTSVKTWYCPDMNPSTIAEPTEFFLKTMTYDETGEFLIRENDPRGDYIYTTNEYDTTKCLLNSTTSPNGQQTSYTYDPNTDLVTKVSSLVGENEYSVLYGYTNRRLTSITHNGFNYGFTYDGMGRAKDVKIAGMTYSTNDYLLTDTTTVTTTYATGEKMKVETDRFNQPIKTTYIDEDENATILSEIEYDSLGRVTKSIDNTTETEYNYKYDGFGNITEKNEGVLTSNNVYDANNRLVEENTVYDDYAWQTARPIYDKNASGKIYPDNAISGMEYDGCLNFEIEKDAYGRVVKKSYSRSNESEFLSISYEYYNKPEENGTRLTNLVKKQITRVNGGIVQAFYYYYDKNGNISTVEHSDYPESIETQDFGVTVENYEYDGMNQLIREDNRFFDKTVLCTYDNSGNILTKKEYVHDAETPTELLSQKNYSYPSTGWKDKLSSVNNQPITYDALGNPLSYLGHTLTWDKVRQLKTFDNNTFSYNSEGIRTKKNDIDYIYHNGKLFIEQRGFDNRIIYYYDESGIAGFTLLTVNYDEYGNFNGLDTSKYVFEKNLQGDVIGIYNDLGSLVAQYRYDAWGNCMITQNIGGMATFNAIRYRGYYYDTETGLYYLKSRYYDPNTGRFINADVYVSTGIGLLNCNMYAYCHNNPIVGIDPNGMRTYVLNGINNELTFGSPDYIMDFVNLLEEMTGDDVKNIPLYNGQEGIIGSARGVLEVLLEMNGINVYTDFVVRAIIIDLIENPLQENEMINLIGYSGGGQVALNVMERLSGLIDNVFLIGAPIVEAKQTTANVYMFWGSRDILSWYLPYNKTYYMGDIGHVDYFKGKSKNKLLNIIGGIIDRRFVLI